MLELLPTEAGILRAHLASVLTWGSWRNQPLFPGDPCQLFSQPRAQAGVQGGESSPKAKQRIPAPVCVASAGRTALTFSRPNHPKFKKELLHLPLLIGKVIPLPEYTPSSYRPPTSTTTHLSCQKKLEAEHQGMDGG